MEILPKIVVATQGILFVVIVVILIFLIVRRVRIKKNEDFEKRDN